MSAAAVKSALKTRPPIIVVMGHVDHGKTTLLDTIRQEKLTGTEGKKSKTLTEEEAGQPRLASLVESEAGGITQHIGAYEVEHTPRGSKETKRITFIDTPGHEAFSAMRLRGTKVADVALLVVAADDGVKPQTKEVISYIQKSKLPFVVVINKIDKPDADVERVKNELGQENVMVEGRGGKVPVVEISAKEGKGVKDLLDVIVLVAELEELTYDAVLPAEGYVIESRLDPKRGITHNLVLTNGTLRIKDNLVCGPAYGKIKIMEDHLGKRIKGAIPSAPIQVVGLSNVSVVGDPCRVVFLESEAKEEMASHQALLKERLEKLRLEPEGQERVLTILVKADVQGTLEALVDSLRQIGLGKIGLKIVKCEVGEVNESDVKMAEAAKAKIFSFRVKTTKDATSYAKQKKINIERFEVIYEFIKAVKKEMSRLMPPEIVREELGWLDVLTIFRTEPNRMIVGGKVISGKLAKGMKIEIVREEEVVGRGKIVKLQKGEEEQDEAKKGSETGVLFEWTARSTQKDGVKIKEGDTILAYKEEKIYPKL